MIRIAACSAGLAVATLAYGQSPRGTAEITLNDNTVSVEYGRPSLHGRDMLGQAPVGTVWRLGADQATTMTATGAVVFGNMVVQKGSYSLFLERVSDSKWSLVINKQTGQWGTEHDRSKDLLGIPLKWEKHDESVEQLSISLTKETDDTGILSISWGKDVLRQRFRLAPPL